VADDELDDLYRARPEDFTGLRTRLAAAAKGRGDAARATQISASRKPTIAAWVVNRLALGDKEGKQRLVDLGERLRAAHAAMDGEQIRELSTQQRELIHELARAAFDAAGLKDPPAALRDDVTDTLQAAIADPEVADQLGRLSRAQRYSGFGAVAPGFAVPKKTKPASAQGRHKPATVDRHRDDLTARRQREQANAVLAAAERDKNEADAELSERRTDRDVARRRRDEARKALDEAERELSAAEHAYGEARKASGEAAELVKEAESLAKQGRG